MKTVFGGLLILLSLASQVWAATEPVAEDAAALEKADDVKTIFAGKPKAAWDQSSSLLNEIGNKLEILFNGQRCTLDTTGQKAASPDQSPPSMSIVLTCNDKKQTMWDIKQDANGFVDDPPLQLLWAGDADGDGKIDLYMDLSWKYSCGHIVEFDSSTAKSGELVGKSKRPIVDACPD